MSDDDVCPDCGQEVMTRAQTMQWLRTQCVLEAAQKLAEAWELSMYSAVFENEADRDRMAAARAAYVAELRKAPVP